MIRPTTALVIAFLAVCNLQAQNETRYPLFDESVPQGIPSATSEIRSLPAMPASFTPTPTTDTSSITDEAAPSKIPQSELSSVIQPQGDQVPIDDQTTGNLGSLPDGESYFHPNFQTEINGSSGCVDCVPDFSIGSEFQSGLEFPTVPPIFTIPANQKNECCDLTAPYAARAELFRGNFDSAVPHMQGLPTGFQPWWAEHSDQSVGHDQSVMPISLNDLLQSALCHSAHIQIAAAEPHISQTNVFEEAAKFDWLTFLESKYDDTNDPIGNELTTGNNDDRFTQQEWYARGGIRRRNLAGGETELSQRLGYLDNNSRFLIPPDQGSSRLELNYRQPLLRGRGRAVNESLVLLANIDLNTASDEFLENLQSHLTDITETYWELVRSRSEYLQRNKLLRGAESILANLQGRASVDAMDRQIYRAQAAVAKRRAEIARSLTSIKNAESRLRLLVNDPKLLNAGPLEYLPIDMPNNESFPVDIADAISTAMLHRPDLSKAIRDVKASNVRLGVAKNEVLPKLDFLVGTYVAGLDGDSDALNSWVNQFRDGRPGFNVGFEFEIPIGNRSAGARQQRRQWEVNRSLHQFRAVVETGLMEVEVAVREVQTAHKEMQGRYHAMVAADNETSFLIDRWQTLPEVDDSVTLLLENLLDSQERMADEEAAFARAQFDYSVATVRLKQAMGTLFRIE